jgi:hypothetical protein
LALADYFAKGWSKLRNSSDVIWNSPFKNAKIVNRLVLRQFATVVFSWLDISI